MSDNEATIKAFLAKLGWDLETSGKRVEDVLKNKKLSNTLVYLSKEVRHVIHRFDALPVLTRWLEALNWQKQALT